MARGRGVVKRRDSNSRKQAQKLQLKKKRKKEEDDEEEDEALLQSLPSDSSRKKKKSKRGNKTPSNTSARLKTPENVQHSSRAFRKHFWTGDPPQKSPSDELKALRKSLGVNVKGAVGCCPPPISTLTCSGIPASFEEVFRKEKLSTPTAVQKQAWPAILSGSNVLGIAPTGSGKTLAYGLPMIPHILDQPNILKKNASPSPVCLVIVPTRELALQVAQAFKSFKSLFKIRSVAVYGGIDRHSQIESLSAGSVQILIATPGRLLDLNSAGEVCLDQVTFLVIDEADRMLALGFEEQLNAIARYVRPDRQTLLFSATFPGKLRDVSSKWLHSENSQSNDSQDNSANCVIIRVNTVEFENIKATPSQLKIAAKEQSSNEEQIEELKASSSLETNERSSDTPRSSLSLTLPASIRQHVHVCASHKKPRLILKYINRIREKEKADKVRQVGSMIVFCTKIKTLQYLVQFLEKNGIRSAALHGQLLQNQREQVLSDFKAGKINIVCATDLASRGIHIKRLKYVVNYDFPGSLEQYCHRVGRTGRQGEFGDAYSLLTRNMAPLVEDLITLLQNCQQPVEPNLLSLKEDYLGGNACLESDEDGNEDDNDESNSDDNDEDDNEGGSDESDVESGN